MDSKYSITLRLSSNTNDFEELIPKLDGYETVYNKKGTNLVKDGSIKVRANNLCVHKFFTDHRIDNENISAIISAITPLMEILSVINVVDLEREVLISGTIENQQFGFKINADFISLLEKYSYALSFSGIVWWGTGDDETNE